MRPLPYAAAVGTLALVLACSKSPGEQVESGPTPPSGMITPTGGDASAPVNTVTGSVPTGGTTTDAAAAATADEPAPSRAAPPPVTAAPRTSPAPATKDASKDASAESDAPECGKKPLPDCPLQAWMKKNANPPVSAGDLPALAQVMDRIAKLGPAEYSNWASIAEDGARAARAGDMTAAKAACRSCHDQYKKPYKADHRARPL
jgi:hypothetical protein